MPMVGARGQIMRAKWINSIEKTAINTAGQVWFFDADAPATETSVEADGFLPYDEIVLSYVGGSATAQIRVYMENAPGWNAAVSFQDDWTTDYVTLQIAGQTEATRITGRIFGHNVTSVPGGAPLSIIGISYRRGV